MQSYIKLIKRDHVLVLLINFSLLVSSQTTAGLPEETLSSSTDVTLSSRQSNGNGNTSTTEDSKVLIKKPLVNGKVYNDIKFISSPLLLPYLETTTQDYNIQDGADKITSYPAMDNIGFLRVIPSTSIDTLSNRKIDELVNKETLHMIEMLRHDRDTPKNFVGRPLNDNDNNNDVTSEEDEDKDEDKDEDEEASSSNEETTDEPIEKIVKHRREKKRRRPYHEAKHRVHQLKKSRFGKKGIGHAKRMHKSHKRHNIGNKPNNLKAVQTKSVNYEKLKNLHNEKIKRLNEESKKNKFLFETMYGTTPTPTPLNTEHHHHHRHGRKGHRARRNQNHPDRKGRQKSSVKSPCEQQEEVKAVRKEKYATVM